MAFVYDLAIGAGTLATSQFQLRCLIVRHSHQGTTSGAGPTEIGDMDRCEALRLLMVGQKGISELSTCPAHAQAAPGRSRQGVPGQPDADRASVETVRSRPRFDDQVHRRLGRTPEMVESGFLEDCPQLHLSGLSSEGSAHILR